MELIIKFVKYSNPVMPDSESSVTVSLSGRSKSTLKSESVDVHFEFFKDDSEVSKHIERVNLTQFLKSTENEIDVSTSLRIPHLLEEPDSPRARCYYYVFVTAPGGTWTPDAPEAISEPLELVLLKKEVDAVIAGNQLLLRNVDVGGHFDNLICDVGINRRGRVTLTSGTTSFRTTLEAIDQDVVRSAVEYLEKQGEKRYFKSALQKMKAVLH